MSDLISRKETIKAVERIGHMACSVGPVIVGVVKDIPTVKTEALSEEEIDNMQEKYYQLGKISQLEDIAREIRSDAGDYFKAEKDELAEIFRSFAVVLEDRAAVERKKWDQKYPKEPSHE